MLDDFCRSGSVGTSLGILPVRPPNATLAADARWKRQQWQPVGVPNLSELWSVRTETKGRNSKETLIFNRSIKGILTTPSPPPKKNLPPPTMRVFGGVVRIPLNPCSICCFDVSVLFLKVVTCFGTVKWVIFFNKISIFHWQSWFSLLTLSSWSLKAKVEEGDCSGWYRWS